MNNQHDLVMLLYCIIMSGGLVVGTIGLMVYRNRWEQCKRQLTVSNERLRIIITLSGATVFEFDIPNRRYNRFENSYRIFGMSEEELLLQYDSFCKLDSVEALKKILELSYHPDDVDGVVQAHLCLSESGASCFEARINKVGEGYIWCRVHISLVNNAVGKPSKIMGHIADIDDEKRRIERLRIRAETDALSGLHNRAAITAIVDTMLQHDPCGHHCLMLLDVDNFKAINDNLGHIFGDSVLVEISQKLKQSVRGRDFVGRIGGDEFVVFMPHIQKVENALKRARDLCSSFQKTYSGKKTDHEISFSIGLVVSEGESSFSELLHKADIAMYQAKTNGKNQFHLYDGTEQVPQTERMP